MDLLTDSGLPLVSLESMHEPTDTVFVEDSDRPLPSDHVIAEPGAGQNMQQGVVLGPPPLPPPPSVGKPGTPPTGAPGGGQRNSRVLSTPVTPGQAGNVPRKSTDQLNELANQLQDLMPISSSQKQQQGGRERQSVPSSGQEHMTQPELPGDRVVEDDSSDNDDPGLENGTIEASVNVTPQHDYGADTPEIDEKYPGLVNKVEGSCSPGNKVSEEFSSVPDFVREIEVVSDETEPSSASTLERACFLPGRVELGCLHPVQNSEMAGKGSNEPLDDEKEMDSVGLGDDFDLMPLEGDFLTGPNAEEVVFQEIGFLYEETCSLTNVMVTERRSEFKTPIKTTEVDARDANVYGLTEVVTGDFVVPVDGQIDILSEQRLLESDLLLMSRILGCNTPKSKLKRSSSWNKDAYFRFSMAFHIWAAFTDFPLNEGAGQAKKLTAEDFNKIVEFADPKGILKNLPEGLNGKDLYKKRYLNGANVDEYFSGPPDLGFTTKDGLHHSKKSCPFRHCTSVKGYVDELLASRNKNESPAASEIKNRLHINEEDGAKLRRSLQFETRRYEGMTSEPAGDDSSRTDLPCPECSSMFSRRDNLERHLKEQHKKLLDINYGRDKVECPKCKKMKSRGYLAQHLKSCEGATENNNFCKACEKNFTKLKIHNITMHGFKECSFCSNKYGGPCFSCNQATCSNCSIVTDWCLNCSVIASDNSIWKGCDSSVTVKTISSCSTCKKANCSPCNSCGLFICSDCLPQPGIYRISL